MPGDCLVLMVSRDSRSIVPNGNTLPGKEDVLAIIGSIEYTAEIKDILMMTWNYMVCLFMSSIFIVTY